MARVKQCEITARQRREPPARIGDLLDHSVDVFCWCNRCGHHAVLEARALLSRLGPAFPTPEIGAHMRCSSCGARDVATRPDWPTPGPVAGHGRSVVDGDET